MANSHIAKFITEVAPPRYVSVMRRRASSKMLDTISEEDRDFTIDANSFDAFSSDDSLTFVDSSPSFAAAKSEYLLIGIQRTLVCV
ncbi:unnamed protein product [Linum trigynum]|uniref:Uncharacterized protein n=1 Tax=Linum trigynum TaxID=586398 RepID=A0AAV2FYM6_9ROSI